MRRFIIKVVIWCIVGYLISDLTVFLHYKVLKIKSFNGPEVAEAISYSKKQYSGIKYLVIGDSVGKQLYDTGRKGNCLSLACNQAISMAGHFFLLNNYLLKNEQSKPQEIILVYSPWSFRNNLDQYAYHYMLKHFYNKEYKAFFTRSLKTSIHSIPHFWTSQIPFIKHSNYSVEYKLEEFGYGLISPITKDYLVMIDNLCKKNDIPLRITAPPVSEDKKEEINSFFMKAEEKGEMNLLFPAFEKYYENIQYVPADRFVDNLHFVRDSIPYDFLGIISAENVE